jgi:adenosine deaminase
LSFEIVSRLNPSITREEYQSDFIAPVKCTNLADFLTRAPKGIQLMQTEHELRLVTEDLFQQLQSDGVIYAEIRFAPLFHSEKGLLPEEVVGIVEETAAKASTATGVEARLILCTLRHFTNALGLYQHDSAHDLCSQGFQAMLYGIVAVIIYSIFPSSKRKALRFCLQSAIFLRGRNG